MASSAISNHNGTTPTESGPSPTGFEHNLTELQSKALDELKSRVAKSDFAAEYERDPGGVRMLLQFLRATMKDKHGSRIFQVEAAFARLSASYTWRKEHDIEEMLLGIEAGDGKPDGYELFQKLYPCLDCYNDTRDVLVRLQRFGKVVTCVDFSVLTMRQWIRCLAYECLLVQHVLRQMSIKHGREISTYVGVSDMRGLSLRAAASKLGYIKVISAVASDYFPEMTEKMFLVNAPWVFPSVFTLAKPFLDKDLVAKFNVSSDVPVQSILAYLPAKNFPIEYGGEGEMVVTPCLHDKEAMEASSTIKDVH